jgi:DNA-binding FrmR family transcriptional regulator
VTTTARTLSTTSARRRAANGLRHPGDRHEREADRENLRHEVLMAGYSASKSDLITRLARAEGQVRGISRMVEEERYCIDVLTQINAARAALDKIASVCSTATSGIASKTPGRQEQSSTPTS